MSKLYESPLRVYLALGALALWGIICGLQLPVSLFPNSSRPTIEVNMGYGDMSANEFLNTYGRKFEADLQAINVDGVEVEKLEAAYNPGYVEYDIEFKWGADARKALRETQNVTSALTAQLSQEIRSSTEVQVRSRNSGYLAVSFYSQTRSLDDLYKLLEPQLVPPAQRVRDAAGVTLWNPMRREIQIELDPGKTSVLQLFPRDVAAALTPQLSAYRGGTFVEGLNQITIEMPPSARNLDELRRAVIPTRSGRNVHLGDVARVDYGIPSNNTRSMKTSGAPSLILFASPRAGGNIKRMAEDILAIVEKVVPDLPKDVEYRVLVDPSEFIRSAVGNVVHEVALAALLAVVVLFLFIGNIRNVVTAAIEIPMSIVLAFILMRLTGINLNMISLGGLALSAGMNVDGSVVVMENIFRHFEGVPGNLSARERLRLLVQAVNEVRFPILASTVASLVVFIPLAFTSALTNAILGDLAMAVVFSHGFSALVALVLVPTVRLQLMSRGKGGGEAHPQSVLEPYLRSLEALYARTLDGFLGNAKLRLATYGSLCALLAILLTFVLPRLPREIVGKPDTDWMVLVVTSRGNTLLRQMESVTEPVEARLLDKFHDDVSYTFTIVENPNESVILARLKDKSRMRTTWKALEAEFANTPEVQFAVDAWNPSELEIPNPPNLEVSIRGNDQSDRVRAGREIHELLQQRQVFPRLSTEPDLARVAGVQLLPGAEQWAILASKGKLQPADIADISRTATLGRRLWQMPLNGEVVPVQLTYPTGQVNSMSDLESMPVGVNGKLVPMKALARLERVEAMPNPYRVNGTDLITVKGRVNQGEEGQITTSLQQSQKIVAEWKQRNEGETSAIVTVEDADRELNGALRQLGTAVALSVLLILFTMVIQFGDFMNSLLVLVSVPLGFIGVLTSLFVFRSTLSLNSVLGIILLNGIAVANSIILVDFLKRLVEDGISPHAAALQAARARLRPILMTSMCTGLGMVPVALGLGEGGRILQPLGIAVVGGLAFSMLTTLFIVPGLQVSYLNWRQRWKGAGPRPAQPFTAPTSGDTRRKDWLEPSSPAEL